MLRTAGKQGTEWNTMDRNIKDRNIKDRDIRDWNADDRDTMDRDTMDRDSQSCPSCPGSRYSGKYGIMIDMESHDQQYVGNNGTAEVLIFK